MLAVEAIQSWHWAGFIIGICFFLALDLGLLHREAREIRMREAVAWTICWFILAMMFAAGLLRLYGSQAAGEFVTGYIVELALSMDNVFVIAMIFTFFGVPSRLQHRVLFWGILGAMVMRGLMIWLGVELVNRFHWILYMLGAFLIFTGIKMAVGGEEEVHPERNPFIKLARKFFPVTNYYDGQHFTTKKPGYFALTPLALVLMMVETTDLIFAVDSIPAIFGVTRNPFIIFTSNVFAILGLRSLYFLLAGAMAYFEYLKFGLALVLIFIGGKMLLAFKYHLDTLLSLIIVAGIIFTSVMSSLILSQLQGNNDESDG
ncbi:MAG: TerC family protein [Verrucomicrobia bacterium]|jgi:tellurite resistance protein TerC|nr:TerC family protein [Verrucomicrobiota bacterium]